MSFINISLRGFVMGLAWLVAANVAVGMEPREASSPFNPGNVFMEGEDLWVPASGGSVWVALDDTRHEVASGPVVNQSSVLAAHLGRLPIGWYRVEFRDSEGRTVGHTTAAVLHKAETVPSPDTPVAVDAALSWLTKDDATRRQATHLAASLHVGWIRDRLHWREIQPTRESFAEETKYDQAATLQAQAGMNVLQVFHTWPKWVQEEALDARCPDLRLVYAFCRHLAKRFGDSVGAWEPWNEANAPNFGGWTINELCSFQKAAYLGFKAGKPDTLVGWAPLGGINNESHVDEILANETWPYYDTYNIHSYDWPHAYEALWAPARRAACGKPLWVTECDRGLESDKKSEDGDFTPHDDLLKAQLIPQEYASSLYAGARRHFHFVLPQYGEGAIQFGLLRHNLTPRPSYVALAAVGRFLDGAVCLGRLVLPDCPDAWLIAFRSRPDGVPRDVVIAWTERPVDWPERGRAAHVLTLPATLCIEAVHDYLGRRLDDTPPATLGSAPVYLVMPHNQADQLPLTRPSPSEPRSGAPSSIVLQLRWPGATIRETMEGWSHVNHYAVAPNSIANLQIQVYNFGPAPVKGTLEVASTPDLWTLDIPSPQFDVEPWGTVAISATLRAPSSTPSAITALVVVKGRVDREPSAVLAFCPRLESRVRQVGLSGTESDGKL